MNANEDLFTMAIQSSYRSVSIAVSSSASLFRELWKPRSVEAVQCSKHNQNPMVQYWRVYKCEYVGFVTNYNKPFFYLTCLAYYL